LQTANVTIWEHSYISYAVKVVLKQFF